MVDASKVEEEGQGIESQDGEFAAEGAGGERQQWEGMWKNT